VEEKPTAMPKIDGFRIKNFRVLRDVTLGKLWNQQRARPLSPLTAVIGKNGSGKSSLFDAFDFLADCLKLGVEDACDARGRGGYEKIHSAGQPGPIEFEIYYREDGNARPITYELAIDADTTGRPFVARERLRQTRSRPKNACPFSFLILEKGRGLAWEGADSGREIEDDKEKPLDVDELLKSAPEGEEAEKVDLNDNRHLGIATLGALKQHPRIAAFRRFIEGWHLSYFTPDAARGLPLAGPQKHLNPHGDNLGNVVQFMEREYKTNFEKILQRIAGKTPEIEKISLEKTKDGRPLLCFSKKGFKDPFYAQQMSGGTLKIFAYLLLLEHPDPPPFLCVEEPENGIYYKLLEKLATEFRERATGCKGSSQIFITTQQPYFVNALAPEEVWLLEKDTDGFSKIHRASDIRIIRKMVEEGIPLGTLWVSNYFEDAFRKKPKKLART
jgi:predicted ATPase